MTSQLHARPETVRAAQCRFEAALNRNTMAALLAASFEGAPPDRGSHSDGCQIVDAKHRPGGRATVLYRLGDLLVLGVLGPDGESPAPGARAIAPLGMQAYPFPFDPLLPGLPTAVDGTRMKAALSGALPECVNGEWQLLRCRPQLLRYRPTQRATLRLDLVVRKRATGAIANSLAFAKLYSDQGKALAVYRDTRRIADSPLLRDAGVAVATPQAFVSELGLVVFSALAGRSVESMLGTRAAFDSLGRVASAIAALHGARLPASRSRPVDGALARMHRRAEEVVTVDPTLGRTMVAIAERLRSRLPFVADADLGLSLIHGDCKPSQFLATDSRVSILDFDHCGLADAACDVGDFLAGLRYRRVRFELGGRRQVKASLWQESERHFLAAYGCCRGEGRDLLARACWYQAAALLRKAYRAFQRSPRSPLPGRLVLEACQCLDTLGAGGRTLS